MKREIKQDPDRVNKKEYGISPPSKYGTKLRKGSIVWWRKFWKKS